MDSTGLLLLLGAGLLAGAMNALAGGGSFFTLPALVLAGVPALDANASSTVALLPGALASVWAWRGELRPFQGVSLRALLLTSGLGGLLGSLLLLFTPRAAFEAVLPWLLLWATVMFAVGRRVGEALRRRVRITATPVLVLQLLLAIYGGYFGGAVGIMMMAVWSLVSSADLRDFNPPKALLVAATNSVAVLCFLVAGRVAWAPTLPLLGAAIVGGYAGARLSQRLDPRALRWGVLLVSGFMTVAFFVRAR